MVLQYLIVLGAALVVASGARASFVQCEDSSLCPDGATCCKMDDKAWGCCPYEFGQCCEDGLHCCPSGYSCDGANSSCTHKATQQRLFVTVLERVSPLARQQRDEVSRESSVGNVRCPDGNYCQDGQTCCLLASGHYGCCPYQHAQCCSDHTSCCPEGYQCRVSTHQCVHSTSNHTVAMVAKVDPIVVADFSVASPSNGPRVNKVRCPDGSYCLDGQTCCLLASGHYGCCPYQHAECCSDHTSCCPEGYRCRVSTHQCVHSTSNHTVAMVKKVDPILRAHLSVSSPRNGPLVNNVRCPDGSYCLDGQTCCLLASGHYGCCPFRNAECCSDHTSCCPEGYRCRVSTHQCVHATSNHTVAMVAKVGVVTGAPRQVEVDANELSVQNVPCPDGNYCLDGQTCCLLTTGQYGCCPYPHAQCCSDHASCCPEGYLCKVSTRQCLHSASNHTVPMGQKVRPLMLSAPKSASRVTGGLIPCPDGAFCQDTQTCCLLTSGRYGCCPYVHAECCSDHVSCCPEGYRCKISTRQCVHATSNHTVAMLEKVDSIVLELGELPPPKSDGRLIHCPDGGMCFNNQTCCELYDETYNCCPYPRATCCEDYVSCCPEGFRCIITLQKCVRKATGETMPMYSRGNPRDTANTVARPIFTSGITCPDGHKCLNGQTCCQLTSGKYGCCPLPEAVCCSDHLTCCPKGYQCRVATQTCQMGDHSVPAVLKVPSFTDAALIEAAALNQVCPDGNECDDDQTCCQLQSGSYGCCPYNQAVCCNDKVHCCPAGYTCDAQGGRCLKGSLSSPMGPIVPKRRSSPAYRILVDEVKTTCPDQSMCPDKMTCCKSNTTYVCCPFDKATCCPDGEHCCPEGYQCDEVRRMCTRKLRPEDVPALSSNANP